MPARRMENGSVKLWPPLGRENLALPCGKCLGCRAARATQWARRCGHEAKYWQSNVFLTLTYDDEHLPAERHLRHDDLTRFLKRLRTDRERNREAYTTDRNSNIKYFACGEYGEENQRPHYHAIVFNIGFKDQYRISNDLFGSSTLSRLWQAGKAEFGNATQAAANYIAQYSLKKIGSGDCDSDGVWRPAPFLRMSTRPAIGYGWLDRYSEDLQNGYLVNEGRKTQIPRSYLRRLATTDPQLEEEITYTKQQFKSPDDTPERRKAAEIIHRRKKQFNERHL